MARRIRISKRSVDQLEPAAKRFMAWDVDLPAFGCEVLPSGTKTFRLMYRHKGRLRNLTLGRFGSITAEEARDLAKKALGHVAHGGDPAETKIAARRALTMADAFPEWLARHVDAKRKPVTRMEYRRLWVRVINPALGRRKLADVSRADVSALHRKLSASPYQANRCVAVLRSFFSWCERQAMIAQSSNPARMIEKYPESSRERFLSPDELQRLGEALKVSEREEWPWAIAAILLIMFTGARRGEILGLRWEQVDLAAGTARLPDSKTGAKTLYLSAPARAVLDQVRRMPDNPYVICGRLKGGPLIGLPRVWRRVRDRAKLPDLRLHDLRHTFASWGAMGGMPLTVIGRLLGHSQPSVTDRYAHFASSPLVAAADVVAESIAGHLRFALPAPGGPKPASAGHSMSMAKRQRRRT